MDNNSKLHNRHTTRIPGYEYTQAGAYFITVVTKGRERLFGEITNGRLVRNNLAAIIQEEWERTAIIRPGLRLDALIRTPTMFMGMITILVDGGGLTLNTIEASGIGRASCSLAPTAISMKTITRMVQPAGRLGQLLGNSNPSLQKGSIW